MSRKSRAPSPPPSLWAACLSPPNGCFTAPFLDELQANASGSLVTERARNRSHTAQIRKTETMKALRLSTVLALLILTEIVRADPLDAWTWRSPLPPPFGLSSMVYGNGQFVAVGRNNGGSAPILTSAD